MSEDYPAEVKTDDALSEDSGLGAKKVFQEDTIEDDDLDPLDLDMIYQIEPKYTNLLKNHPVELGKSLSRIQREELGLLSRNLVYGESSFIALGTAIEKIRQRFGGLRSGGGVFYDLGSGIGKPCFAAALLHPFDTCIGVEILSKLHDASNDILEKWNQTIKPTLGDNPPDIEFILADISEMQWADATVVFAHSTAFDSTLMESIEGKSEELAVGSFFITFTKRLTSPQWKVLDQSEQEVGWGRVSMFIHQKISDES